MFRYFCDQCTKSFNKKVNLRYHIEFVHEGKGLQCELCDYRTLFNGEMENHMEVKHPDKASGE